MNRLENPSLLSLMVSVDVKHHVYLLTYDSKNAVNVLCNSITGDRALAFSAEVPFKAKSEKGQTDGQSFTAF